MGCTFIYTYIFIYLYTLYIYVCVYIYDIYVSIYIPIYKFFETQCVNKYEYQAHYQCHLTVVCSAAWCICRCVLNIFLEALHSHSAALRFSCWWHVSSGEASPITAYSSWIQMNAFAVICPPRALWSFYRRGVWTRHGVCVREGTRAGDVLWSVWRYSNATQRHYAFLFGVLYWCAFLSMFIKVTIFVCSTLVARQWPPDQWLGVASLEYGPFQSCAVSLFM